MTSFLHRLRFEYDERGGYDYLGNDQPPTLLQVVLPTVSWSSRDARVESKTAKSLDLNDVHMVEN